MFKETKFKQQLAEIPQTLPMRMAICKKNRAGLFTNVHPFVQCRDFMGDVLWANQQKNDVSIYGFSYNGKTKAQLPVKSFHIAIKFPEQENLQNFIKNYSIFGTKIENQYGLSLYTDILVDFPKSLLVVLEVPTYWKQSIHNLSLLTFIYKCFGYKLDTTKPFTETVLSTVGETIDWDGTKSTCPSVESRYMIDVVGHWSKLLTSVRDMIADTVSGHPANTSTNTVHNRSGFVTNVKYEIGNQLAMKFHNLP